MNTELENLIKSIVKANPNARINVTSTTNPDEEGSHEKEIYSYSPPVVPTTTSTSASTSASTTTSSMDVSGSTLTQEERRRRAHKVFNVVAESLSSAWVECLKRFIMFVEPKYGGSREELRYLAQVAFSSSDELPEGYYYADEVIDSDDDVNDDSDTDYIDDTPSRRMENSVVENLSIGVSGRNNKIDMTKLDVPLPWLSMYDDGLCHALRRNNGLYTQCMNGPSKGKIYCSRCIREARDLDTETKWGTVEDRLSCGVYEYVDPRGKKPVSYMEFLEKRGHSFEEAYMKARSQGTRMCKEYIQEYEDKHRNNVKPNVKPNVQSIVQPNVQTIVQNKKADSNPQSQPSSYETSDKRPRRLQRLTDAQFEELMESMPPEEEAMFRKRRAEIKAEMENSFSGNKDSVTLNENVEASIR